MPRPRRIRAAARRASVAAVAACHFLLAVGFPAPAPAGPADATPFPCRGHRCGCATAAACWAGACCCYSMSEKLAWAAANGVTPPAHAAALAAAEPAAKSCCVAAKAKSCCTEPAAPAADGFAWVDGPANRTCRGAGAWGVVLADPHTVPAAVALPVPAAAAPFGPPADEFAGSHISRPASPPPRG